MQLHLLHLDDALADQPEFLARCGAEHARALDVRAEGAAIRLWGKRGS